MRAVAALACLASLTVLAAATASPASVLPAQHEVRVERIAVDGRFGRLAIAGLEAHETDLTAEEIAHLFDPEDAGAARGRWPAHAGSIRIGRMDLRIDDAHALSVEGVELEGVADGRIAAVRIARSRATSTDLPLLTTGPLQVKGLDVGLLIAFVTSTRRDAALPVATLFEALTVDHFGAYGGDFLTIESIRIDGVKLRPLQKTFAAIAAGAFARGEAFVALREYLLQELTDSIAIDKLEAVDAAWPSVKIGRLTLSYAHGILGEITVRDAASPQDGLRLRETHWEELDLMALLAPDEGPAFTSAPVWFLRLRRIPLAATHGQVRGLVVGPQAVAWMMDGLVPFAVAEFDVERTSAADGGRSTVTWSLSHLTATLPPTQTLLQPLADIGYKAIDVSCQFVVAWDSRTKVLTDDLSAHAPGIGRLALHVRWLDASADPAVEDATVARAALLSARLATAELRIDDEGLTERILAAAGRRQAADPDAYRAATAAWARAEIMRLGDGAATRSLAAAIAVFLQRPRRLVIAVTAQPPLQFADLPLLRDPAFLLGRLRIEATANP